MAEDNTIKLSGTMGGNATPTGVNIAYANVEDLEQFIQFDRKAEGNVERINEIKKTILDKGYLYDTAYEGGVVFGVIIDEAGNVQIPEGNHRLQALIDVAKETGQEIYVPINPMLTSTGGGNKVQLTNSDNAYNSMKQLLTDMLEGNKNFNVERTISEKLGEPGTRIIGLESYTYPGGAPGTSTNQSNIKKFFNSIGLNTITYDELPDNNIYKTGVNTFTDTPTNVVDDIPDNIQKLIDEGKVIKTKTSSGAFRVANQNTLVIDKSTVTSKEYKELKKFADEFEYMLIKPYKFTNQTSGVKTNNFDVMKSEYFNYNTTEIEKLYSDDYSLAIYTPHQDQVAKLRSDIFDEYSQYFDKRFQLEMYPYKGTEFTDGKSVLLLKKIYIKPEFQGQGIGSEIINKVTNFADELNIPIMLSTDPATKLSETLPDYYARFGFLDTGDVEAHTGNRERILIRQPGELAGKIVEYGELADDFKTYEEALQAARNTDKPLYPDYIIKQITDRGQTVPGLDTPTNVVDDVTPASVVDEAVEYIDNLNIDSAIKKEVKDKIVKVTGQASGQIPIPGVGQAIDAWETAVLAVGAVALAAGEIDELPKVIYNYGLDLYESILSGYNIPYQPAKRKEYTPNFERISSGLTWIDKLQPTSYVINPVIEEFQETAATTPTMEVPGFGTVPASEYYQPPVQSTPERDNINTIMTNLMQNISNAQGAYPITASEIGSFTRNPIRVVPQDTADKPEKVEYDSKEKQNLHDIYAKLYKNLSDASARIQ